MAADQAQVQKIQELVVNLGISVSTAVSLVCGPFNITKVTSPHVWDVIQKYFNNSAVGDHLRRYGARSVQLNTIYQVHNDEVFLTSDPNKLLLWHGTSEEALKNVLTTGLVRNSKRRRNWFQEGSDGVGMFGDGIYFADRVTKSMQYVGNGLDDGFQRGNHFILLCEVALGKVSQQTQDRNDLRTAPDGYDSVKGAGRNVPDPNGYVNLNNVYVPTGYTSSDYSVRSSLLYNEYVIYNERRAKVKYIVAYRVY